MAVAFFTELGLDVSVGKRKPPKLEDDVSEGTAADKHECPVSGHINALSTRKEKVLQRKVLFRKWRPACRSPGLQA